MKFLKTIAILLLVLVSVESSRYSRKNLKNTLSEKKDDVIKKTDTDDEAFAKAKKAMEDSNAKHNENVEAAKKAADEHVAMKAKAGASDSDKQATQTASDDAEAAVKKTAADLEEKTKAHNALKAKVDAAAEKAKKDAETKKNDGSSSALTCNRKKIANHQAQVDYLTKQLAEKVEVLKLEEAEVKILLKKIPEINADIAKDIASATPAMKALDAEITIAYAKRDKRIASNKKMTEDIESNKKDIEAEQKNCAELSAEEQAAKTKAEAEDRKFFDSNFPQGFITPDILPLGTKLPLTSDDAWSPIEKAATDTMVKIEPTKDLQKKTDRKSDKKQ